MWHTMYDLLLTKENPFSLGPSNNPPVTLLLLTVAESLEFHHWIFMLEAVGCWDAGVDNNNKNNDHAHQKQNANGSKHQGMTSNVQLH